MDINFFCKNDSLLEADKTMHMHLEAATSETDWWGHDCSSSSAFCPGYRNVDLTFDSACHVFCFPLDMIPLSPITSLCQSYAIIHAGELYYFPQFSAFLNYFFLEFGFKNK